MPIRKSPTVWVEPRDYRKGRAYMLRVAFPDGTRYSKGLGMISKKLADKVRREKQQELDAEEAGVLQDLKPITFREFVEEKWLPTRCRKALQTQRRDRDILRVWLGQKFGARPLKSISVEDVDTLLREIERKTSPYNAKRVLAVLRHVLNMARKYRYVKYNAATDAETIKLPPAKKRTRYFTVDELEKILRAAQPGDRELILVTVLTGLRWGEVTALEPRDFIPEKEWGSPSGYKGQGVINVTRQIPAHLHPDKLKNDDPKSEHGIRTVQLPWPVRMTLMDLDVKRRANADKRFFRGPISDYLEYNTFNARWRKLLKDLGIRSGGRRARFHDLRHTLASLHIAWGATNLTWIAEGLGHGDSRLVHDTYGHLMAGGAPLDREATLNRLWEASRATNAPALVES